MKQFILIAFTGLMLCLLGACATPDRINMGFDMGSAQPIANGLPHPETWVYLGTQRTSDNKVQAMAWVKPVAMHPRPYQSKPSQASINQALAQLFKPREKYPNEYSELFEYQDLPRPANSPQEYLDLFKQQQLQVCPSGSVTPIRMSNTELLFEAKSGGCEHFGDQDEIDCFLFGKTDLFHMSYMVKSREMTPEQREIGIKAVTIWQLY